MALLDDVNKVLDNIDRIAKEGVPVKLEHEIEGASLSYLAATVLIVGLLLVVASGFKDYLVGQALKR